MRHVESALSKSQAMSPDSDERLNNLEILLCEQDQLLFQLNEVVIRQQQDIDLLKSQLEITSARLKQLQERIPETQSRFEIPPHY